MHAAQNISDDQLSFKTEPIFKFKRAATIAMNATTATRAHSTKVAVTGASFGVGLVVDGDHWRPGATLPSHVKDTSCMHTLLRHNCARAPKNRLPQPRPMTEWTREEVHDWLASLGGMEEVAMQAHAMGVDGRTLANFTDVCWSELGVSSGKL